MHRRARALISAMALTIAAVTPNIGALAAQPDGPVPMLDGTGHAVVESPYGSYIVVMKAEPLVATEGRDRLDAAATRSKARALRSSHTEVLREAGAADADVIHDYTNALNGFAARLTLDQAEALAGLDEVALVLPDELQQPQTDATPHFLGLTRRGGAWRAGLTGEGVVVGVIDTGIWPEHPSFADDGTYDEPPTGDLPCDFGNAAVNPADADFECQNKLIGARQMLDTYRALIGVDPGDFDSARDADGHGTHTASTAAGNLGVEAEVFGRAVGRVSGIAPRAHVVAYKGLGLQGGFTSDLVSAIDQAVADGVDVINYSIGGGPSLIGGDDISFLFAAAAGVHVATSAGNSGPGAGTVGGPGSVPWITTVGANTQPRFFRSEVRLGNGETHAGASLTPGLDGMHPLVDAEDAGDDLCNPGALDAEMVEGSIVLCRRGAIARVDKSLAVQMAGGVGMILYENSDEGDVFTDPHHLPTVHVDNTPGLAIKSYIDTSARPTASLSPWKKDRFAPAPSMTSFSSRGPNVVAEDIIKPDITAPGHMILAGHTPVPADGVAGELFQSISGTSMSSPHVAGLFALLVQANPDWSPAMTRSALMTTARTDVVDNDRVTPADPFDMGAGMAWPGSPWRRGSSFRPGLVYDAGINDYFGFLCGAAPEIFVDAVATCGALEAAGFQTDASDLNLPSIGVAQLAGSQTVVRTVTSVADATKWFRAKVDAPAGYDVEVRPKVLKLAPGESATYEVIITNDGSGAIDEWAFGSLTWWSRGFAVRSPIAVKGALLGAPEEISGTGTEGAAAFDVHFGYTGDYTAAPHGLVPATVTSDVVVQDPDQDFDPTDGYSNAHPFDLAGVAHFRVRIPPEATEPEADLDVFVTDPSGAIVAASTSGGTDEAIDITLPEDGTWTVWIHGWQAPGGDSPYDLSTWQVPLASGGSLGVDSAPTSAEVGVSGTVEVSWSGLDAATHYLGAVSHADGDGLLGLTLVDVTTG